MSYGAETFLAILPTRTMGRGVQGGGGGAERGGVQLTPVGRVNSRGKEEKKNITEASREEARSESIVFSLSPLTRKKRGRRRRKRRRRRRALETSSPFFPIGRGGLVQSSSRDNNNNNFGMRCSSSSSSSSSSPSSQFSFKAHRLSFALFLSLKWHLNPVWSMTD